MAKCAIGRVLSIARRLAVTPAAARVNIAVAGCNALAQSTGMANKHVRVLLVEAVWRLLRWQPNWHARQKYLEKLRVGASLKRKWRWHWLDSWPSICGAGEPAGRLLLNWV